MGDIVAEYQERVNKKANPVKSWLFVLAALFCLYFLSRQLLDYQATS